MSETPTVFKCSVQWSEEDEQWVGLSEEYPSLSFLSDWPSMALAGVMRLVADILEEKV